MLLMYVGLPAPTNVKATVLTPNSVEVTWDQSLNVTGYLISCATTASFAGGKNVTVNGGDTTNHTLTDLVENTPYDITVQGITRDGRKSLCSNEVSIKTSIAGKCYIIRISFSNCQHVHTYVCTRFIGKFLFLLA